MKILSKKWTGGGASIGNRAEILPTVKRVSMSIDNGMRMSAAEEAVLIARAQQGDMDAFCELASCHQRNLYVLALKYSGNHHDAEDLTQDVMMNAYRAIQQFKGMSSFRTWLSRIMVNSFLNQKRKSDPLASTQRQEPADAGEALTLPHSGNSERKVHNGLVMQQILKLLQSVPERQRL